MKHYMRLHPEPFDMIKSGTKTAEGRLNDKKRSIIQPGDEIVFLKRPEEKESVCVNVIGKTRYGTFLEMAEESDHQKLGFDGQVSLTEFVDCYREYYSAEEEQENGVLVIEFEIK